MLTQAELAAIKAKCNTATSGPWAWRWKHSELRTLADRGDYQYGSVVLHLAENLDGDVEISDADDEFIAHARTDVPLLLAEVDALQIENARLREIRQSAACQPNPVDVIVSLEDQLHDQGREIDRLRAALAQYAEHGNWMRVRDYYLNDRWKPDYNGWEIAEKTLKGPVDAEVQPQVTGRAWTPTEGDGWQKVE